MKVTYLTVCCAKNFTDIDTARASMSENVLVIFLRKKSVHPFSTRAYISYPQTTKSTPFTLHIPKMRSVGDAFRVTLKACILRMLCEHSCVSRRISLFDDVETFPAGKRRNIPTFACRRPPAHGLSFFFLQNA